MLMEFLTLLFTKTMSISYLDIVPYGNRCLNYFLKKKIGCGTNYFPSLTKSFPTSQISSPSFPLPSQIHSLLSQLNKNN